MHVDAGLLAALIVFRGNDDNPAFANFVARLARIQLGLFYFAAGFWKYTQGHTDWRFSCSSIFLPQITMAWLPRVLVTDALLKMVIVMAPHITTTLETGLAFAILFGKNDQRRQPTRALLLRVGIFLSIALHIGIMVAPFPNSVGDFGAMCLSRLFLTMPEEFVEAMDEISTLPLSLIPLATRSTSKQKQQQKRATVVGIDAYIVIVSVVVAIVSIVHTSVRRIVANITLTAFSVLMSRAILTSIGADGGAPAVSMETPRTYDTSSSMKEKAQKKKKKKKKTSENTMAVGTSAVIAATTTALMTDDVSATVNGSSAPKMPTRAVHHTFVFLAGLYALGLPFLGLIDVGACNMFSHLKVHGGSSHYLLPTGLVQRWLYDWSPLDRRLGIFSDFAGGELRIESSTSTFLNAAYPNVGRRIEPEPMITERLRSLGNIALMFSHPGVREWNIRGKKMRPGAGVLGLGPLQANLPNGSDGFIRYTLPSLEMRMMLKDMRRLGESFTLEYTRIRGPEPMPPWFDTIDAAEHWRINGCGTRVYVHEKQHTWYRTRVCLALDTCAPSPSFLPPEPNAVINRISGRSRKCAKDEIAMIDVSPGLFARTMLLSNPYPILDGLTGRFCGTSG